MKILLKTLVNQLKSLLNLKHKFLLLLKLKHHQNLYQKLQLIVK